METLMDQWSEKKRKKKKNRDLISHNSSDSIPEVSEMQESGNCEHTEERKKKKKKDDLKAENSLDSDVGFREVAESNRHESREGGTKKNKRNIVLETSANKELVEKNTVVGFRETSETQDSGGYESAEGAKRKKKKNNDARSDNFDKNVYEESPGRKEKKKKKNAGIETEEMLQKSSEKRKSKGLLDVEIEKRPLKYSGRENDQFNENLMEENLPAYSGSENDRFRENSTKDKDKGALHHGSKKTRAIEECVRGKDIREQHIAENEKMSKKKHGLGQAESKDKNRNLMEKFEEAADRSTSVDKSMSAEAPIMKEKPFKKKKKKIRADGEETVAELQNSDKSASTEKTEEDSAKKKKVTKEKGFHSVVTEEAENPNNSAKAKSKEKRKRERNEREMVSGDDDNHRVVCGDAEKSSTDGSPSLKNQKKVTFSKEVEVCGEANGSGNVDGSQIIWGKRFSQEEDQAIRDAVSKYIKEHGLDEVEGLHMILNCMKQPKVRNCWKEIALALPRRPFKSVYNRGHLLYERSNERCWIKDEIDELKRLQNEHGKKWNKIAQVLGKSRYHVKDKWRAIKRGGLKRGRMSQDEYERLHYWVNYNKQLKLSEKGQEHTNRSRRDSLNWEAIADKMGTRDHAFCCKKWYRSFESPLIEAKLWKSGDDQILLRRLLEISASDEEAVDWDDLVEGRRGEICLKRWKEMVRHSGEYHSKPFCEKLDLVVKRFASELLE
ncbi:hypothetical protein KI387_027565 [Taxus chinensis]|uniref:Uncharacterized protein n=1 Tax=Taxus chinensis TaxID=29808 RepID=A0AA38L954_TAXCH|nr:hypothetical protein KI387_027565 [Taxus chinensis]